MKTLSNVINEGLIADAESIELNIANGGYKDLFNSFNSRLKAETDALKEIVRKKLVKFYTENPTKRNGYNQVRCSAYYTFSPLEISQDKLVRKLHEEYLKIGLGDWDKLCKDLGTITIAGNTISKFNVLKRETDLNYVPEVEYKVDVFAKNATAIDSFSKVYDFNTVYPGNMYNYLPGETCREYMKKFFDCIVGADITKTRNPANKLGDDIVIKVHFKYDKTKLRALYKEVQESTKLQAYAGRK